MRSRQLEQLVQENQTHFEIIHECSDRIQSESCDIRFRVSHERSREYRRATVERQSVCIGSEGLEMSRNGGRVEMEQECVVAQRRTEQLLRIRVVSVSEV